ncbi:MAG TPA: TIM-barrel domain-containing protein, partial [Pyrinomonadaceae bacterium]|nr:TIM-barrel domain-containing protein [Pyrinomonadaceae bacterium]
LYTRWLQAAALTPMLRSHSENGSNPHEPYSFPAEYADINRASIELRYRLLPYLYSLFEEHTRTGAPVMRPLWFEHPDDARTYLIEDEYLVGRDLLVAPVVTESVTKRRVYFPAGDDWVDWWDGKTYKGGSDADVGAPLDRLPLFARAGAAIPTQPVIQHTGEMASAPLLLAVVRGADGASSFYEDAGEGYDYARGASRTVTATQRGGALRLGRSGAYNVSRPLAAVEYLGLGAPPRQALVGGRAVTNSTYDAATRRLVVPLPAENVEEVSIVP